MRSSFVMAFALVITQRVREGTAGRRAHRPAPPSFEQKMTVDPRARDRRVLLRRARPASGGAYVSARSHPSARTPCHAATAGHTTGFASRRRRGAHSPPRAPRSPSDASDSPTASRHCSAAHRRRTRVPADRGVCACLIGDKAAQPPLIAAARRSAALVKGSAADAVLLGDRAAGRQSRRCRGARPSGRPQSIAVRRARHRA